LEGVVLFGSLKNWRINKEIIQRGMDHKAHILNTMTDMAIDAVRNGQPSFAMIGYAFLAIELVFALINKLIFSDPRHH
jgi:hypothetical protein